LNKTSGEYAEIFSEKVGNTNEILFQKMGNAREIHRGIILKFFLIYWGIKLKFDILEFQCIFRFKPATDSGVNLPVIPF